MKTDIQLQQDVLDELRWEPRVDATEIGVEAKHGVVTLAGHVQSYAEKWAAEDTAQRVAGVKGVVVEIDVRLPNASQRSDIEIVEAARNALDWDVAVPKNAIKIAVKSGVVTLSGEVDWAFQRSAAVSTVRNLTGVRDVTNSIMIKAGPIDKKDVRRKIKAAFHRHAQLDADAIEIDVDGHSIKLDGKVGSLTERLDARNAAWAVRGVQSVQDNLTIAE